MSIQIGDAIPEATLNLLRDGVQAVTTHELFKGKKVVLFCDVTKMWDAEEKRNVEVPCIRIRAPKN